MPYVYMLNFSSYSDKCIGRNIPNTQNTLTYLSPSTRPYESTNPLNTFEAETRLPVLGLTRLNYRLEKPPSTLPGCFGRRKTAGNPNGCGGCPYQLECGKYVPKDELKPILEHILRIKRMLKEG